MFVRNKLNATVVIMTVTVERLLGTMKTYWLEERESRVPLSHTMSGREQLEALEWERSADALKDIVEERSRVYSPVTFQELARRSIDSSPIKLKLDEHKGIYFITIHFLYIGLLVLLNEINY